VGTLSSDHLQACNLLLFPQSLKAAALGLNLTVANHVVLVDLWWNPTTEEQAIDRAHRIGQTRPVQVGRPDVNYHEL
jgi:SNF2 family DNA or RNA helicase